MHKKQPQPVSLGKLTVVSASSRPDGNYGFVIRDKSMRTVSAVVFSLEELLETKDGVTVLRYFGIDIPEWAKGTNYACNEKATGATSVRSVLDVHTSEN